ncbi:MAG: hypothetical protein KQH63_09850 [Desulfobulbaceae bacterium]|nr:hypothetical protein [Desulfobulbaceae bacterium]
MQLFRCRVAGHFILHNSDWFTIHARMTTITGPTGSGKSTLLKALGSLNPPFCHPDPAPFADFPQYVRSGKHTRRVIPAKKTAAIGVFICDDLLRNTLAEIDPVFMKTDRIEVGRRLDSSRWITYVEISASSRWSELAPYLEKMRRIADPTENSLFDEWWQECETIQAAERIKGNLAERANRFFDGLTEHARAKNNQDLLQKVRFIVNREARFKKAREITGNSLPVLFYLHKENLLSSGINVDQPAGKVHEPLENHWQCVDLFFQELLRSNRDLLRKVVEGTIPFKNQEISLHQRWMLSCAVIACYFTEIAGRQPIFLLDEPDAGLGRKEKNELEKMLRHLSESFQVIVCTCDENFLTDSRRRYQLQEKGGEVRVVRLREQNRSPCRG